VRPAGLALALAACQPLPEGFGDGPCADASRDAGRLLCAHHVPPDGWGALSVLSDSADRRRVSKHLTPAHPDAPLPTLVLNANLFDLHGELLVSAFPDLYAGLTTGDYSRLVLHPEERDYTSGNVVELSAGGWAFTAQDLSSAGDDPLTYAEVEDTWARLSGMFEPGALAWLPITDAQIAEAEGWSSPAFEIAGLEAVAYEPYTPGVGFGTVRLLDVADLDGADLGYQDILALDAAPFDVETVVSGVVTGGRQAALSHLNVRSAARGTPNCYIEGAHDALAAWEGALARLECGGDDWSIREATPEEAEAWWAGIRPDPVAIPAPDLEHDRLAGLLELPTLDAERRALAASRYGAKGANLAALYQRIPADLQLQGFLVPFSWYDRFARETLWIVDLGDGLAGHSFQQTLDAWLADPAFQADAALRGERLESLQAAMEEAPVDPAMIDRLERAILETWGTDDVTVRLRSSSNAEDALAFSGAGLYDSTSACLADERDADEAGPSRCDPDEPDERDLRRALTRVWASLWSPRAFDERGWYGIDHRLAAMGALVNTRSKDERVNAVAFTGDPVAADDRFLVNAQLGAWDVVAAEPGVTPEVTRLATRDGEAFTIAREAASSQAAPGEVVLDDGQLEALGEALWTIQRAFPVDFPADSPAPEGADVLLDTEWKVLADGRLVVKQVRPFLRR